MTFLSKRAGLLTYLLFTITIANAQSEKEPLFPISVDHEFSKPKESFEEVMSLILNNYYSSQISEKDLYWAGIKGMLRHISPPESPELATIWTPEEYEMIINSLSGVNVSIGITSSFNAQDGSLTVKEVAEGSPADSILFPFDRILRINGLPLVSKTIKEINQLLDGPEGSTISMTISRDISVFEVILVRNKFEVKNLEAFYIPSSSAALIRIKKITLGIADAVKSELQKIATLGYTNIILDLRNNGGGVLNEGLNVVNLFLSQNDVILRTLARSDQTTPIISNAVNTPAYNIIVLINKQTASASEVIVAALRDHKIATVIGTRTFGKSVIEETFTMNNDYKVKFIKSAMFSPRGISWQTTGLLPDILVQQSDETYQALMKIDINEQLRQDLYLITALKLFN